MANEVNSLPTVTSEDNGKVLVVQDGAWEKDYGYGGITVYEVGEDNIFWLYLGSALENAAIIVPEYPAGLVGIKYHEPDSMLGIFEVDMGREYWTSQAVDPAEAESDRYLFSEAGIPYVMCNFSEFGRLILVSAEYEDKLIPGTSSGGGLN